MRKSPTRLRRIFGGGLGAVSEFLELRALPCFFSFTERCGSVEGFPDAPMFSFLFFCLNFVSVGASMFAISSLGLVGGGNFSVFQYLSGYKTIHVRMYNTQAPPP